MVTQQALSLQCFADKCGLLVDENKLSIAGDNGDILI